jgi:hypothetical protein
MVAAQTTAFLGTSGPGPRSGGVRLSTKLPASKSLARLAQSVERKTLNLVVVGSSPTVGVDVSAALLDNLWAALPIVAKSKNTSVLTRAFLM